MTSPQTPEGFPDLIVYALKDAFEAKMGDDIDFPGTVFLTRPVRPDDPNQTVAVFEGMCEPVYYEIMGTMAPSIWSWQIFVQVMVKSMNEVEGRNIRKRLLTRVRKTLFLPSTVSTLMTLSDESESVSKFRVKNLDYAMAGAKDNRQLYFVGMVHLDFETNVRTV